MFYSKFKVDDLVCKPKSLEVMQNLNFLMIKIVRILIFCKEYLYYVKKYKTDREWSICLKYTDTSNMLHWLWIELNSNSVFVDYVRLWLTVVGAVLLFLLRHRALASGRVMTANCYASKLFLRRIVVFCPVFLYNCVKQVTRTSKANSELWTAFTWIFFVDD